MKDMTAVVGLALFGLSIIMTYFTIRNDRLRWQLGGPVGWIVGWFGLLAYGLISNVTFLFTLLISGGLSLLFTIAAVSLALYFRANSTTIKR